MLKLKLQYFGHPMQRVDSLKKTLMLGGTGDDRGWDGWMASPTQWAWVWVDSGSLWWTGRPGVLRFMGLQRVGHDWVTELNWTELKEYGTGQGRQTWGEFHLPHQQNNSLERVQSACLHPSFHHYPYFLSFHICLYPKCISYFLSRTTTSRLLDLWYWSLWNIGWLY